MAPRRNHAAPPGDHPPAAVELLPMLVWLNRRELATRFPAWQPLPGSPVGERAEDERR